MKTIVTVLLLISFFSTGAPTSEVINSGELSFAHPLESDAAVLSNFGLRTHPILNTQRMHNGIDFQVREGEKVYASEKGTVIFAGQEEKLGNFIMIQHLNGFVTRYAHLQEIGQQILDGAKVEEGQVIGLAGKSGQTTGPFLHFEILVNGEAKDPLNYLQKD